MVILFNLKICDRLDNEKLNLVCESGSLIDHALRHWLIQHVRHHSCFAKWDAPISARSIGAERQHLTHARALLIFSSHCFATIVSITIRYLATTASLNTGSQPIKFKQVIIALLLLGYYQKGIIGHFADRFRRPGKGPWWSGIVPAENPLVRGSNPIVRSSKPLSRINALQPRINSCR